MNVFSKILEKLRKRDEVEDDAEPEHRIALAAATLMLEVAWADQDIADTEVDVIRRVLSEQFQLPDESVEEVIAASREHHDESVGLFRYTQTINEAWGEPEKFELVVNLWRLAFVDETIDRFEEHMIRKITDLLYVSHERFIAAKRTARRNSKKQ
jgi:uncharacterized tellurite resistance protein B-like protein